MLPAAATRAILLGLAALAIGAAGALLLSPKGAGRGRGGGTDGARGAAATTTERSSASDVASVDGSSDPRARAGGSSGVEGDAGGRSGGGGGVGSEGGARSGPGAAGAAPGAAGGRRGVGVSVAVGAGGARASADASRTGGRDASTGASGTSGASQGADAGRAVATARIVRSKEDREPVPGARVDWVMSFGSRGSTTTDEAGRVTIAGSTGDVRLHVDAGAAGLVSFAGRTRGGSTEEAPEDLGDVPLAPPGGIRGFVRDAAGRPLAGIGVSVSTGVGRREVKTDAAGAFDLGPLAAELYSVNAATEPEATALALVRAGEVFELVFGGVAQVRGVLTSPFGLPLQDRTIAAVSAAMGGTGAPDVGADLLRAFGDAGGVLVEADASGAFLIGGLRAGPHYIGQSSAFEEVTVPAAGAEPVFVSLAPCLVRASLDLPQDPTAPARPLPALTPVHEEDLLAGLAGDARRLIVATLSHGEDALAQPGGRASLVPRPGRYLLLVEHGPFVAAEDVRVEARRGQAVDARLRLVPTTCELRFQGFPREGGACTVVVREAAGSAGAETMGRIVLHALIHGGEGTVRVPTGRFFVQVVAPPETRARATATPIVFDEEGGLGIVSMGEGS